MKVLQINAVYGFGSTGVITKDIQECSMKNGIDAYVAFSKGMGKADDHSYEIGSQLDHKIHALLSRIAGKQSYFSKSATKGLLKYIDGLKPDIVHLHNLHSNYINLNMLLKYLAENNIHTIITMHDCWYFTGGCFHYAAVGCERWKFGCGNCPKQKADTPALLYDASASILKDRVRYLSQIPDFTLVGASEWIANEAKKSLIGDKREITYIHNGFDLDVFKPQESDMRKRLGLEGKFVVLGPASKWLLPINKSTFDYFKENLPKNCVLLLFGSNTDISTLPENVKLYGYTRNRQELADLYSMADVMVNCSREDTLSSLNLECQACGTPVVTYDATGSNETVDGKCGFAVGTGDFQSLFLKVMNIIDEQKSGYSTNSLLWIRGNFEKIASNLKYINLYNHIIDGQIIV